MNAPIRTKSHAVYSGGREQRRLQMGTRPFEESPLEHVLAPAITTHWPSSLSLEANAAQPGIQVGHISVMPKSEPMPRPAQTESPLPRLVTPSQLISRQVGQGAAVVQRDLLSDLLASIQRMTAIAQHRAQQTRIANIIQQGLAIVVDPSKGTRNRDNLLHNSCEWIQQGQCRMVILTPTHDSTTRDPTQGVAYFDPQVSYPNVGGDYPADPAVKVSPHLQYGTANDLGGLQPGGLVLEITNPARQSDDQIKETLIHEVQHDADQTWPGQVWAVAGGAAFNDYQSEFRSYWIENPEGSANDHFGRSSRRARNNRVVTFTDPVSGTTHTRRTRFRNRRQENIFWHLVDAGYGYVPRLYATDRTFRRMVNSFSRPVGGNLVNSVRIQAVSQALTACTPASTRVSAEVTALFTAADQLDQLDRRFLSNRWRAGPFWQQARASLSPQIYRQFRRRITT